MTLPFKPVDPLALPLEVVPPADEVDAALFEDVTDEFIEWQAEEKRRWLGELIDRARRTPEQFN